MDRYTLQILIESIRKEISRKVENNEIKIIGSADYLEHEKSLNLVRKIVNEKRVYTNIYQKLSELEEIAEELAYASSIIDSMLYLLDDSETIF